MKKIYFLESMLLLTVILIASGLSQDNNTTGIECSDPITCYNQGIELLSKGNCTDAYGVFIDAIKFNQSYSEAWTGKAKASACLGNYSESIKYCDAAMAFYPGNVQAYIVKASVLLASNRSADARDVIEDAVRKNITNPELWTECGKIFYRMEMWEDAQKCFKRATELNKTNAEAWYMDAFALQRLGRFDNAISAYNQSVKYNSSNADAWYGRSQALATLGLFSEAEKSFTKVLELDPTNENALFQKGQLLLLLKRYEESEKCFNNLTELAPQNISAWAWKGFACAKIGRCNESLAAYDNATDLDRNRSDIWIGRGDAQLCLGFKNQALETYNKVLNMDKRNGPVWERMARILFLNGNYPAALTYAKQAIEDGMAPPAKYARAWFTYGNALDALRQHKSALEQYSIAQEKVRSDSPLEPEMDQRELELATGRAYLHMGDDEHRGNLKLNGSDFTHARDYFKNLTDENESDKDAWMMQGICNYKLWQFNKADECFGEVLKIELTNKTAAEWSARVSAERCPHIDLVSPENDGIDFGSITRNPWNIFNWQPPETFRARLKNLADIDGVAEITIWTVESDHVKRVKAASLDAVVEKNFEKPIEETVRIPWNAFRDLPSDPASALAFLMDISPIELKCEVAVKNFG